MYVVEPEINVSHCQVLLDVLVRSNGQSVNIVTDSLKGCSVVVVSLPIQLYPVVSLYGQPKVDPSINL